MTDETKKDKDTGERGKILPFIIPDKEPQEARDGQDRSVVGAYACSCGNTSFTIYADGLVQCGDCYMYASNLVCISRELLEEYDNDE